MENTLIPGDKVLVNKLLIGPRLPRSPFEIPWVNIAFFLNQNARSGIDSVWWDYYRIQGFNPVSRNDIVVFNQTIGNTAMIKRCVALPGDTLLIDCSEVFINGDRLISPETIQLRYKLYPEMTGNQYHVLDSLEISYRFCSDSTGNTWFEVFADQWQIKKLREVTSNDSVFRSLEMPGKGFKPFVSDSVYSWSIDFFGPLIIPFKGLVIPLNHDNYVKYKMALRDGEGVNVQYIDHKVYIEGKQIENYKFQYDYYFMMGDNRYDSKDSRYIGLIPEYTLVGKAKRIVFSNCKNDFRWDRIFKKLE